MMPTRHAMLESLRMRVCGGLPQAMVGPIEAEPEMCSFGLAMPNRIVVQVCGDADERALFAVIRVYGGPILKLAFESYYDGEIGGGKSSLTAVEVLELLRAYSELPAPGPTHGAHRSPD